MMKVSNGEHSVLFSQTNVVIAQRRSPKPVICCFGIGEGVMNALFNKELCRSIKDREITRKIFSNKRYFLNEIESEVSLRARPPYGMGVTK